MIISHCGSDIFMMLPYDINISRKYQLLVGWEIRSQLNHTSGREVKSPVYLSRHLPTPETISRNTSHFRRKGTLEVDVLFYVLKKEDELFSLSVLFLFLAVHGEPVCFSSLREDGIC
jgi:hypothetical protein